MSSLFQHRSFGAIAIAVLALCTSTVAFSQAGNQGPAPQPAGGPSEHSLLGGNLENKIIVRDPIGAPLIAAEAALKSNKFREALDKVREAEAKGLQLTADETYLVNRYKAAAAIGLGDLALTIQGVEAAEATGKVPDAERMQFITNITHLAISAGDQAKVALWGKRYASQGGNDEAVLSKLIFALQATGNHRDAASEQESQLRREAAIGKSPSERQLQILAVCYTKLGDKNQLARITEQLLRAYPTPARWVSAINEVSSKAYFEDKHLLDYFRLLRATKNLKTTQEFLNYGQLALEIAGQPTEAKTVLSEGLALGLLGTGPEADKHRALLAKATRQAAEDQNQFEQSLIAAQKSKDGNALVRLGITLVTAGQAARGAQLIEQGIAKGGLKSGADALLYLGEAQLAAGQGDRARAAFKAIPGGTSAGDLAKVWAILAEKA